MELIACDFTVLLIAMYFIFSLSFSIGWHHYFSNHC